MMAGARHDNDQLPVIVLGRGGGRLSGGKVLDYSANLIASYADSFCP